MAIVCGRCDSGGDQSADHTGACDPCRIGILGSTSLLRHRTLRQTIRPAETPSHRANGLFTRYLRSLIGFISFGRFYHFIASHMYHFYCRLPLFFSLILSLNIFPLCDRKHNATRRLAMISVNGQFSSLADCQNHLINSISR